MVLIESKKQDDVPSVQHDPHDISFNWEEPQVSPAGAIEEIEVSGMSSHLLRCRTNDS